MRQIPIYFENINRSALVLKPKKPFIDWIKNLDDQFEKNEIIEDPDIYLLPDFEEVQQMVNWLKKNYDMIFIDQMNNWYTDETLWVTNRTFKLFKEWFDFSLHTMILDTVEQSIKKL